MGNRGYRRYLKTTEDHFEIEEEKIKLKEIFDGKWVLRTNTNLTKKDVALKYKQLLMVEDIFRTMKSILDTRPVFHKCDDNISGHVFCSFLALVLRKELQDRIAAKGWTLEWADIIRDVNKVEEVTVEHEGKRFVIRTEVPGVAGKAFQAAGVALPPVLAVSNKKSAVALQVGVTVKSDTINVASLSLRVAGTIKLALPAGVNTDLSRYSSFSI